MIRMPRRSPSKFGGGISLLWRGARSDQLRELRTEALENAAAKPGQFVFESARTALFHCLAALGIGVGDEVVVCAFTCSAVTYGVQRSGATVVYADINDDLTMNDAQVLAAVGPRTKAVIVQNTLGRLGLRRDTIEKLKAAGLFVIEDCALSIGSVVDGKPHGSFGDVSIWSLELSKTLTLGWGGVLTVNAPALLAPIAKRVSGLRPIPAWRDRQRLAQLRFSVAAAAGGIPGGLIAWCLLYGSGLFRGSADSETFAVTDRALIGRETLALFRALEKRTAELFAKTNANYLALLGAAKPRGLLVPVVQAPNEFVVTPRLPLILEPAEISKIAAEAAVRGIELGRWFDEAPPVPGLERARVASDSNAKRISARIVNFPCHWSLSEDEIRAMQGLIEFLPRGAGR